MKINILRMELENFKGVKKYAIEMDGKSIDVYGDNRTGKTTLNDAFRWLLFDKNSSNEKVFGVKTIGTTGIDHSVDLILSIDDVPLRLKKSLHEKWTKKRGSETSEFTGNETDYWIDEVPSSKSEFDAKIKSIVDENTFKTVTDVLYFNTQVKWADRRKMLIEIAGKVETDAEIIGKTASLSPLNEVLKTRSIEDHMKIIKEKKTKINNELKNIPVRIDEANKSQPEEPELSRKDLNELNESLKTYATKLGSEVGKADLTLEQFQKNTKARLEYTSKIQTETDAIDKAYRIAKNSLQESNDTKQATLRSTVQRCKEAVTQLNEGLTLKNKFLVGLSNDHKALKELKFDESTTICQTCKREYETSQIEDFKANFNSELVLKSNAIKQKHAALKEEISKLNDDLMIAKIKLEEAEKALATFKPELVVAEPNYETESLIDFKVKLEIVNKEIDIYSSGVREVDDTTEIDSVNEQIKIVNMDIQKRDTIDQIQTRITELIADQKRLSFEFAQLEKQEFLVENFIKAKVKSIQDKINSMFTMVNFKLFETQINGGVAECCEVTVNDVPYQDLNNEAKINAGLDVINCMTKYYDVSCPVFLDNAESVTKYIATDNQLIRLYVSEQDKTLRVEVL